MYDRTGNYLIVAILIGLILGVVTVALFGEAMLPFKFLGDIFLNALKMVVIPLLFCSMIVGITSLGDVRKLGRTGLKTLLYFLATSAIAVVIGLVLVNIIQPGVGFSTFGAARPDIVTGHESYSFFSWLSDQIPSSIIGAAAETKVLPIIVFALFLGGVLTTIGAKGKPVIEFFEGLNEAIMKIVHLIMWFAPIGIFGLVAGQLAASGGISGFASVLSAMGMYSLVVILGLLIHGVIVLPLILKFMGGKNPIEYFVGMSQALMTAFATASSSATLPVTMECAEEKNDVDKRASSFVLPLGATINMDGTALYEAVAAMFIAQAYGIALPIWSQITIFATAVLASVGAAGIPQAGLVTMVLVLQAVGLPLEGIGMILAVDWFLDRCRTTVNVWGDSVGAAVIAATAEIGLVDRPRLKIARPERTSRFQKFTRRKDMHGQRKPFQTATDSSKDRGPQRDKKGSDTSREMPRRPSRPMKRSDRFADKRNALKETPTAGFTQTARREEYRPSDEKPRDAAAIKDKPVVAATPAISEKRPSSGPDKRRPAFGRKRTRPPYNRDKSHGDEIKGDRTEDVKLKGTDDFSPEKQPEKEFEIPKFPAGILADLVSVAKDQTAVNQIADEGVNSDLREGDSQPKDISVPEETSYPAENSAVESAETESNSAAEDFSRLDEAVLGKSTNSHYSRRKSRSFTRDDKNSHASSNDVSTPVEAEDDWASVEDSDLVAGDKAEDITPFEPESREESPEFSDIPEEDSVEDLPEIPDFDSGKNDRDRYIPVTEEISQADSPSDFETEKPTLNENETPSEDASGMEPSSDATASDDDESKSDSMKWGRPKHKKMSR